MQEADLKVPAWLIDEIRRAKKKNDLSMHNFISSSLSGHNLNTVCDGAKCPNRGSCYSRGTATFMILGGTCTRNCAFCAVSHGIPEDVDHEEPVRVREAVQNMGLKHVVVTSVTRDDLPDGGAGHFVATISELHTLWPSPSIEVLTPDFQGSHYALDTVIETKPEIFSQKIETVPRLYPAVRPEPLTAVPLTCWRKPSRGDSWTSGKDWFHAGAGREKTGSGRSNQDGCCRDRHADCRTVPFPFTASLRGQAICAKRGIRRVVRTCSKKRDLKT